MSTWTRGFQFRSAYAHVPAEERTRRDTPKRAVRWVFKTLHTIRHVVLRAGRLTRPEGKLTLTMSGNREVREQVRRYVRAAHAE